MLMATRTFRRTFSVLAALLIVFSELSSMSASVRGCERNTRAQAPAPGAAEDDATIDASALDTDRTDSNIESVPCGTSGLFGTPSGVHAVPLARSVEIAPPATAATDPALSNPLRPPRA